MSRALASAWRAPWRAPRLVPSRLLPRVAAMAVWAALAATVVFWALRLLVSGQPVPARVQTVAMNQAAQGDALRLFGPPRTAAAAAAPAPSPAAERFKLYGVVAGAYGDTGRAGIVSLGVDGGPPRAYRVGDAVDGQWAVQSISRTAVRLGPAGADAAVVLDVPALPAGGGDAAAPALSDAGAGGLAAAAPMDLPPQMMEPPSAGARRPAGRVPPIPQAGTSAPAQPQP